MNAGRGMSSANLRAAYLFCYPWDFADEGVDQLVGRARDLGVTHLAVASLYHAGFFFYPHNPRRKVHMLEDGVAYYHPDPECYPEGLAPQVAAVSRDRDLFGDICDTATRAGLKMCSWTVLLHNSRLGLAHPELTMHNAFGDSYPHALTPGHPTTAAYARGVIRDLASRYPLDTIMLEAADYRSRAHGGAWVGGHHHERQGTYLRELETALLDVSFNPADMAGAERTGVDAAALRATVRAHLEAYLAVAPDVPGDLPDSLEAFRRLHPELDDYERSLQANEARLLQEFRQEAEPHGVRLMGSADPAVQLVMGGAYGQPPDRTAEIARAARTGLGDGQELIVLLRMGFYGGPQYGTPIVTEQAMVDSVRVVADAGAHAVGFYNYAEAPARCVDWIAPALRAAGLTS